MDVLTRIFREGGASMYGILGLDMCGCGAWIPVLILALVLRNGSGRRGAQALTVMLALLGLAPVVLGAAGRSYGRDRTDDAVAAVAPEMVEELRTVGYAESEHPLRFGMFSTFGLLLGGLLPLGLAFREEKEAAGEE